jgi:isocitrate/isopropylmalate dehydrogenase
VDTRANVLEYRSYMRDRITDIAKNIRCGALSMYVDSRRHAVGTLPQQFDTIVTAICLVIASLRPQHCELVDWDATLC